MIISAIVYLILRYRGALKKHWHSVFGAAKKHILRALPGRLSTNSFAYPSVLGALAVPVLFLAAWGLWGCGQSEQQSAAAQQQSAEDAAVFRLNLSAAVSTLDPAFADNQANTWAAVQLFNGLLRLDQNMELSPDLARRWEQSDDGLSYTFYLRTDVWFHPDAAFAANQIDSTRKLKASDVVYSFQRLMDPGLGANGFWVFNGILDREKSFTVLSDSVLSITLTKPFQPFLSRLTMPYCSVLAPEVVQAYGRDLRLHPVGTGPFRLSRWKEGEMLLLKRNPRYFQRDEQGRSLPYLQGVKISFMSAKGTEFLKFRNGELDFVSDLDAEFLKQAIGPDGQLRSEHQKSMKLQRGIYFNTEYLGINLQASAGTPLGDERVRQALSWGIDRERMIAYQRNGKGIPALAGMVPPVLLGLGPDSHQAMARLKYGYRYDPDRAAGLLAQAGYPGGRGMPELMLRTNDQYLDLCMFLQSQWKQIGIPVRVENLDGKILRESMVKGQSVFFRASWVADYPDAESFLALFYSEHGAPPNYTRSNDPALDALYEEGSTTPEATRRHSLYRSMDSLVMQQCAVIPLYYDEVLLLSHPDVQGLELNPMNMLRLERVRKGS